jgi:hypothetical protein
LAPSLQQHTRASIVQNMIAKRYRDFGITSKVPAAVRSVVGTNDRTSLKF